MLVPGSNQVVIALLVLLHYPIDPVSELGHPGVHARVVGLAAANAPAHHSDLGPGAPGPDLHGAAGVSTAGILPLLAGAEHVVHDAARRSVSISVLAGWVVPDPHGDLPQTAPPHHRGRLLGVVVLAIWQADRPHVSHVGRDGRLQTDDRNVLVQSLLTELLVPDDPGRLALESVGFCPLDLVRPQPHLQVGNVVPAHVRDAVGGGEDVAPGDEAAAAELAAVVEQGRDPGPLAPVGRPAVHHAEGMLAVVVDPLLLLRHRSIRIVADGEVLADTAAGRIGARVLAVHIHHNLLLLFLLGLHRGDLRGLHWLDGGRGGLWCRGGDGSGCR